MRSDCASIPTRGSRFVGLLSIIITSALGSGGCEQERSGSKHPLSKPERNVVRKRAVALKRLVILTLSVSMGKGLLLARARPAASCIRDFPEDCRPLRSRGRRHIGWPPMPRLMREQGKSHCLLRFRRKAELIGEMQFDPERCDFMAQHSDH